MKLLNEKFRCDLCGEFSACGVTETSPLAGRRTRVCQNCVAEALRLLANFVAEARKLVTPPAEPFGGKAGD